MSAVCHAFWARLYPDSLYKHAQWLRSLGMLVDQDPCAVEAFFDHPLVSLLCDSTPLSSLERVRLFEALSYGDPGVLLSLPGTGLPGVIVRELGDAAQQTRFFDTVKQQKARTFLAVTEPEKGSDAAAMETSVDQNGLLFGEKWLVGHAATGEIGVAMVRTGPGPFSVGAVLLVPEILQNTAHLKRERLQTLGLRGALLGRMSFSGLPLDEDAFLGKHLHPLQRGMMGLIRTFSRFRPCVASMALGVGQAMVDFARMQEGKTMASVLKERLDTWDHKLAAARKLVHTAAMEVDLNPDRAPHIPLCKVTATDVCEEIADYLPNLLGAFALIEHPWLEKAVRDARAFEYMEGTTNIHLEHAGAEVTRKTQEMSGRISA